MKKIKFTSNKILMKSILTILVFLTLNFSCSKSDSINESNANSNDSSNDNSNNDNNSNEERTTFYLSSSSGNDNSNGSQSNPWKSLSKVSKIEFSPGDSIFFKKGDTFTGHFTITSSGSQDKPIVITSFGSSNNKPIINGSGINISGGDFQEAIYVNNSDNIIFDGLEIQNNRTNKKSGIEDSDSF